MVLLHMITCGLAGRSCTRYAVLRYTVLALLGLGFCGGIMACAPTLVGPTVPSGYIFSIQVSTSIIWLGVSTVGHPEQFRVSA